MLYVAIRIVVTAFFRIFYRIEVHGRSDLPSRPSVIVSNHLSFIDSLFIPISLSDRKVSFLAKAEYFEKRMPRLILRALGQIPCDRQSLRAAGALDSAEDALQSGRSVALYPEGTRSRDGNLYRGRTGAARLAYRVGVPLVPCGLQGTDKVMPVGHRRPRVRGRKRVTITYGEPIDVRALAGVDPDGNLRAITDLVMIRIAKVSGQTYIDEYANAKAG
jgi:1-acyl-sn-glycerol-3-phosphate acyltransferase